MASAWLRERQVRKRRLAILLPVVIAGCLTQAAWMYWAGQHQYHEWPIAGYQEHYLAQLRLKNANAPDLGFATGTDILARPIHSADDIVAALVGLFTHKEMAPAWYAPGTLIPLACLLLGLAYSFRGGGGLLEWYFIVYQGIFLVWPWDFERRFFLPVAPLAFLYLWRGALYLYRLARRLPGLMGAAGVTLAFGGGIATFASGRRVEHPQMQLCLIGWLLVAVVSLALLWIGRERMERVARLLRVQIQFGARPVRLWQTVAVAAVGLICILGVRSQVQIGRANLDSDLTKDDFSYPDIEAAEWIKAHTAASAVIMARKDDIVYHYSHHRVIWFPPSHDVDMLMDGIQRHHVKYVVVHYGNDTYWRPPADECFTALARAYPASFHLVHRGPHNSVFEVSQFDSVKALQALAGIVNRP
jgi:hypothetical protein